MPTPTPETQTATHIAVGAGAQFWVDALHTLAQPVQALALFSDRLQRLELSAQAAAAQQQVGASVENLQQVLQVLVQVAQMDAGYVVAQTQVVQVDALLARLHSPAITLSQVHGLRWRSQGQRVLADPVVLGRLLLSLTEHALLHTQGVGVLLAWRSVPAQGAVRMELWWSQAGAPALAQDISMYSGQDGGLALYAAQRLAQLLGSPLEIRAAPGGLVCLSLRLPAASGEAA